jgi:hypothetical protein
MRPCAVLASAGNRQPPDGVRKRGGALDFGSPLRRCTDSLLVINGLLFVGQWATKDALMLWGAKVNALIAAGQWWRLLTSSFLHTSAFHLLVSEGARGGRAAAARAATCGAGSMDSVGACACT